jgi:hypothetical protein
MCDAVQAGYQVNRALRTMLTLPLCLAASLANACIVRHMSYEQALAATDTTVLGEIVEISPSTDGQLARSFHYRVRLIQSERGAVRAGALIDVELLLHLARKVNGSIRCPLQRGSGMENEFRVGERYRMLIGKEADTFELFWSENAGTPYDKVGKD